MNMNCNVKCENVKDKKQSKKYNQSIDTFLQLLVNRAESLKSFVLRCTFGTVCIFMRFYMYRHQITCGRFWTRTQINVVCFEGNKQLNA